MTRILSLKQRILDRITFNETHAAVIDPRLIASDYQFDDELRPDAVRDLRPAGVLIPIVERNDDLNILLTRRADHLDSHSGQVSFPGGKVETGDADAIAAALRETHEEIGVAPEHVNLVGLLDRYETGTGFSIQPVVGFVAPDVRLTIDPGEVAEAFEVPFSFLMNPANHTRERMFWRGRMREYYDMPYNGQRIWGATAAMLVNFYTRLFADDEGHKQ